MTFFNVGNSQYTSHDLALSTFLSSVHILHFCSSNTELLAVPQVVQYSMSLCLEYLSPFICPNSVADENSTSESSLPGSFPCQPPHSVGLSCSPSFSGYPVVSHSDKEPWHEMELDSNPDFPNFLPITSGNLVTAFNFTVSHL